MVMQVAPSKTRPIDQRQKAPKRALRLPHTLGEDMRLAVRPTHPATSSTRSDVSPLHVPKIFVIERLGQRSAVILEDMNWTVLCIQQRSSIMDFVQGVSDQPVDR